MKQLIPSLALISCSLAQADTIALKTGEILQGDLIETQANFVLLKLPETEGEAIRRVSPAQIDSLAFDDPDAPLEAQALIRSKFIPLLSEADASLLPQYLQSLLAQKQSLTSLTYAKLWHQKNEYTSLDPLYRNLLIESSLAANLPEEALVHAQNWLDQTPQPIDHPLPWQVLAQHYLDTQQFEKALWTSLTPIAHANKTTNLTPLHDLAAQAYQKLRYTEHAAAHLSHQPIPSPKEPLILDPTSPTL